MATVLVIDDDVDIAELIALRLTLDGHRAELVHDGLAGVMSARTLRPDVIIVDWTLPSLTGPDVCRALRDQDDTAGIWIIMLTARPMTPEDRSTVSADDFLAKPFSPRELSQRVSAGLTRGSSRATD